MEKEIEMTKWEEEKEEEKNLTRSIYVNMEQSTKQHVKKNYAPSRGYGKIGIIIKICIEETTRISFIYFLLISIIEGVIDKEKEGTTLAPLIVLITVTCIKEWIEEYGRIKKEEEEIKEKVVIIKGESRRRIRIKDIKEGDMIELDENETVPCDCIILQGKVSIETTETNGRNELEKKEGIKIIQRMTEEEMRKEEMSFYIEEPKEKEEEFEGKVHIGKEEEKVGIKNFIRKGSIIRSEGRIIVLACYIGKETKSVMRKEKRRKKRSYIDNMKEYYIMIMIIICLIMGIISSELYKRWGEEKGGWYINYATKTRWRIFLERIYEYSGIIPISVIITIEIARSLQKRNIEIDEDMKNKKGKVKGKNSGLNEELGRVSHILTDKTGTLTSKYFVFTKCSIGGKIYGKKEYEESEEEEELGLIERKERKEEEINIVEIDTKEIIEDYQRKGKQGKIIEEFFKALIICQTVEVKQDDEEIEYFSETKEELAIVAGSKECGFELIESSEESISINIKEKQIGYRILKRYEGEEGKKSVIVYDGKEVSLYCKGREKSMSERLKMKAINGKILKQNEEFNEEGYLTMIIGMKKMRVEEYIEWVEKGEKEEEIEKDLMLIGVTCVEEELEKGVKESIKKFQEAGIKVWMVTGDKRERAINVGKSSGIINKERITTNIKIRNEEESEKQIEKEYQIRKRNKKERGNNLIIDGESIEYCLKEKNKKKIQKIIEYSENAIFCECTRKQKGEIVKIIQEGENNSVLAVGDSINDIDMINKANIGVGIIKDKEEETEATKIADYSIPEFRFLVKLILVHGRYCYRQIGITLFYLIYKNVILLMCEFIYNMFCGNSRITIIPKSVKIEYNSLFTSLPILIFSIFDRDVPPYIIYKYPKLYKNKDYISSISFCWWLLNGILSSITIFFISYVVMYNESILIDGKVVNYDGFTFTIFVSIFIVVTLKVFFITKRYTVLNFIGLGFSIILFIGLLLLQQEFPFFDNWVWYRVFIQMLQTPVFYALVLLIPLILFSKDFLWRHLKRKFIPSPNHITEEIAYKNMSKTYNTIKSLHERDLFFQTSWHLPQNQHDYLDFSDSESDSVDLDHQNELELTKY
ncbi:phospholipid-transporting p-type ATPase putative [Entamoeba histolytica]|uniref:Phospholipid-transporting ATPase n=6 Tax=Entamoeba histolytica TaxID=5759 RepID=C4LZ23_ENTH1|nr:phospholipid-transporting P-type ATPase, putative [Entamoeba histolytica HM-1:IMSS]EAL49273.1 phospholipid-transporting P-type ATPase, putative [Entamoeba histolytica HM-1:IMSS]EMD48936.1 phospholipid-transporting P-type ATPase, putative [Entamoeba histolytica KU27]ENY65358.1 phospholipid-transporting P-type ATPase, putative [Entamoeba histolytica HM-1:IMSS-A]GAT94093.1 phospholipid-transporting p-type ATPase putative [Entamoeba histolytica]|eukprot:XP_654660.1 phospholipid-transporting P-type ATPase, putative [Entamoeba histolytica HM-1:IMSS]